METHLNPYDCTGFPGTQRNIDAFELLENNLHKYVDEHPQLTQLYIYLNRYYDSDLDQRSISCMQKYFLYLRKKRLKALVLFAYEYEYGQREGPLTGQILRHIRQLRPFLEQFQDCIHTVQVGFVGLWGEWHHEVHPQDRKAILEALLEAIPRNLFLQIRMVDYKNLLEPNDVRRNRVGYMDMYMIGTDHRWSISLFPGTPQHDQVLEECAALLMDGAMPWGTDTSEVHSIDGFLMARRLHEQHFTSLSLEHNYREAGYFADFAMKKWQKQRLTPRMLKNMGLHYAPDWFCNEFGKAVPRSLFDYIRDHLGYLVGIRSGSVRRENDSLRVCGSLMNYGFAAPLGMERLELVLFGPGKRILESHQLCTMMDLQPGHAVDFDVMFPGAGVAVRPGGGFGIRFVNSAGTPARLVNDLPFEAGMNVLLLF